MIYKREPKIHKLPTGWNDMDAVKVTNINGIKGLQHVDNALVADQNGTYNCENVYQDESNNLTIRPALRGIKLISDQADIKVLGYYTTVTDTFIHFKSGNDYCLQSVFDDAEPVTIGEGNITVQESDNRVYILYTDIDGYLSFKQWFDHKLVSFEPDILTNNPNKLISTRFNLLTNKYYANIPALQLTANLNRPWNEYDIEYAGLLDIPENIVYNTYLYGNIYLITNTRLYIVGDKFAVIDLTPYIDGITQWNVCIWTDGTTVYLSHINYPNTFETFIVNALDLELLDTYTVPNGVSPDIVLPYNKYVGSTGYIQKVFDATTGTVLFSALYEYKPELTFTDGHSEESIGYKYSGAIVVGDFVGFLHEPSLVENNASLRNPRFFMRNINTLTGFTMYSKFAIGYWYEEEVQLVRSGFIRRTSDGYTSSYDTILFGVYGDSVQDATFTSNGLPKLYYGDNTITLNVDNKFQVFKDSEYTTVDIRGYTEGGIYDSGATLFVKDTYWNLLRRTVKVEQFVMFRETSDNFPVLSDIKDEVLTSFYLDNIYWFVTKHRVFGTGVANEQFTIKYFDPRKYFHFDEELTGAIRISDSSFWVFHNNGAYLIYKSSTEAYDETSGEYVEMITWLCTSTAESKGCDFENAVMTLPVSNYIACVTSDDISSVQMRENVQTDDRILVPMTLEIRKFVASLLNETESVITGVFKYNALFFLNPVNKNKQVSVLVYNATTDNWWYWKLPVSRVIQTKRTEINIEILAEYDGKTIVYDFYTEYYPYIIGGLTWDIYADRSLSNEPIKIDWFWESALLHLNTTDYKKQLLFTNFTFGEQESSTVSFEYNFEIYDREYSNKTWSEVEQIVERVKTYSYKNVISKFMYLQLYLKSIDGDDFESMTRPKFSAISLKYRLLPGGLL